MSTNNDLSRIRKAFLDAVNEAQTETEHLRQTMGTFQSLHPGILVAYVANENFEPIDRNALHWTETYFSTQRELAKRNFSMERINHLIDVRERFRQDGRKGFLPRTTNPSKPVDTGTGYRPSTSLQKIVAEGDVETVQTGLSIELEDHRNSAERLRAALAWAKARVPNLCERHTEKAFAKAIDPDRKKWTSDYYAKQSVYLETNFSEERFLHLIDVREHVRQQGAKAPSPIAAPAPASTSRPSSKAQPGAQTESGSRSKEPPRRPAPQPASWNLSPALAAALLAGGAIAVVVILILVMRK